MVLAALELEKQDHEVEEFIQYQKQSIKAERKQRNILNCLFYSLVKPNRKPESKRLNDVVQLGSKSGQNRADNKLGI